VKRSAEKISVAFLARRSWQRQRGTAGDEQHQSKAEVGVAERCAGKVDVQPERGATSSGSSREIVAAG
jgi:hypothetical protein